MKTKSQIIYEKAEKESIKEEFGVDTKGKLYFIHPWDLLIIFPKYIQKDFKKIKFGKYSICLLAFIGHTIFSLMISFLLLFAIPFIFLIDFIEYKSKKKKKR